MFVFIVIQTGRKQILAYTSKFWPPEKLSLITMQCNAKISTSLVTSKLDIVFTIYYSNKPGNCRICAKADRCKSEAWRLTRNGFLRTLDTLWQGLVCRQELGEKLPRLYSKHFSCLQRDMDIDWEKRFIEISTKYKTLNRYYAAPTGILSVSRFYTQFISFPTVKAAHVK